MLQVAVIRDQRSKILDGLAKRNFKNAPELVSMVLQKDDLRKDTQKTLDDLKAKANVDAKKIGELIKAGKTDEANSLRAAVATAKDRTKTMETSLTDLEKELIDLLYKIPNVPHEKVSGRCRR
jgi:seryl-tRNA synthetase